MTRIDLHAHSTASDGTESPEELVESGHAAGLDVLAITDHDTTAGWEPAAARAAALDLTLVRGIEISCKLDGASIHLLGYLMDPDHERLVKELHEMRDSRERRIERMVERMEADGIPVSVESVRAQAAEGATLGRPHIADALLEAGHIQHRNDAFDDILAAGSKYYEHHYALDPSEAVRLVHEAGGVAVIAHPFAVSRGRQISTGVVEDMIAAGLDGIEVNHRDHDEAARARAAEIARAHGLIVTGSSDYHGEGKHNRLGENTTDPEMLVRIEERASSGIRVLRP